MNTQTFEAALKDYYDTDYLVSPDSTCTLTNQTLTASTFISTPVSSANLISWPLDAAGQMLLVTRDKTELQEQISKLEKRIAELEDRLDYAPGGPVYEQAKSHFDSAKSEHSAKQK